MAESLLAVLNHLPHTLAFLRNGYKSAVIGSYDAMGSGLHAGRVACGAHMATTDEPLSQIAPAIDGVQHDESNQRGIMGCQPA